MWIGFINRYYFDKGPNGITALNMQGPVLARQSKNQTAWPIFILGIILNDLSVPNPLSNLTHRNVTQDHSVGRVFGKFKPILTEFFSNAVDQIHNISVLIHQIEYNSGGREGREIIRNGRPHPPPHLSFRAVPGEKSLRGSHLKGIPHSADSIRNYTGNLATDDTDVTDAHGFLSVKIRLTRPIRG